MPKMLLLDINVWLSLAFDSHAHHPVGKQWFDGLSDQVCYFCRLTQQGFLRLATNPSVFGKNAVTLPDAWQKFDLFLSDPRVSFADEPEGLESYWRGYTQRQSFSPKVWNDAFLAAFARAADYRMVTFDRGFTQYANLDCVILS